MHRYTYKHNYLHLHTELSCKNLSDDGTPTQAPRITNALPATQIMHWNRCLSQGETLSHGMGKNRQIICAETAPR